MRRSIGIVTVQDGPSLPPGEIIAPSVGNERKVEAFIELMRPYGIMELARTGRIALVRGQPAQGE